MTITTNPFFRSVPTETQERGWFFYDETGDEYGPYDSYEIARFHLDDYCFIMLGDRGKDVGFAKAVSMAHGAWLVDYMRYDLFPSSKRTRISERLKANG